MSTSTIHVGVSACVLGDKVRFDGGHKRSNYVTDYLGAVFRFEPICPEVAMGMPVPRPAIRVQELGNEIHLVDSKDSALRHTDSLNRVFEQQRGKMAALDGYIFCAKSPTCGVERIKVYGESGELLHRKGRGLFAQQVMDAYPCLPVEEDGRLNDMGLRESFITKVYVHHRFRHDVLAKPSAAALVDFHSRHKFLVMAYNPKMYQAIGRLVSGAGKEHLDTLFSQYLTMLMQTLSKPTNRRKHTNVLMHLQGFFKKYLDPQEKQELAEQIDKYRLGYVPLLAPITLLQHHLRKYPNDYLSNQVYLAPYPEQLGLRA
ncbi:YbgA family protein [Fluctibacter halophilus]|nr:DUF1722 domain-containing protein [Aestuariibacter halophilus]